MTKEILVVYNWARKYEHGFGNVTFTVNYDIPRIESIRDMERQIREANNFDGVVILNIIELNNEESEDTE